MIKILKNIPTVSTILEQYASDLGGDSLAYTNHVLRVINYYNALTNMDECPQQVMIAAAFHDLGIWTAKTFDYLEPSVRLVRTYLDSVHLSQCTPEIEAIILHHHKVREYTGTFAATVEVFRKADLIDVSLGFIRFGVPATFIQSVKSTFPDAGFHRKLCVLTVHQFMRTPLRPLPMVRW